MHSESSNVSPISSAKPRCKASLQDRQSPIGRLKERGSAALSDAEVLSIVVGSGKAEEADGMRDVLRKAGSLQTLINGAGGGLTERKQARLLASMELMRRCLFEELEHRQSLSNPSDSGAYFSAQLRHLPYEAFAVLYLDNRHRVLAWEILATGTIDGAHVHPREVVRACLKHNAAAVVLGHQHPSGVAEPSMANRTITHELRDALRMVGVRVLDHLVIGSGEPVSMAARGLI